MKKNNLLILTSLLILNSCSSLDKSSDEAGSSTPSGDVDFVSDNVDKATEVASEKKDNDLFATEDKNEKDNVKGSTDEKIADAPALKYEKKEEVRAEESKVEEIVVDTKKINISEVAETGDVKIYKVKKGETLMQIAFKIYGDISKWKELKKLNEEKVSMNALLNPGMSIKYNAPASEFVWNPEGNPYLIKNGETLGTISNTVYQTPKKWNEIWKNNKPLIKNPNLIYSGFTLYYIGEKVKPADSKVELPEVAKSAVKEINFAPEVKKEDGHEEVASKEVPVEGSREISSKK